jgi:PEP-CTERM motif
VAATTLTGTLNLTNVVEFSGGGFTNNNMTINGLLTVPSGGLTTGGLPTVTAAFLAILAQGGITPPIPGGGESAGLTINVNSCTKGGGSSACIISSEPIGTIASVGITSTTSAVPEPTTLALFGAGLAGLLFRKRFTR